MATVKEILETAEGKMHKTVDVLRHSTVGEKLIERYRTRYYEI